MVRILAIADEEVSGLTPERLRSCGADLVLAAGDLPWDYLEYVASATDVPVVFVPGNHDPEILGTHRLANGTHHRDGVLCDAPRPRGCDNADQQVVEVAGLRVAGLGGCVRYRPGPHQYTQSQYRRRARRLVRRNRGGAVDVLLTHAPPRGLGDEEDPPHHGIAALHDVLARLRPALHLHGHIHPYGQVRPDRRVGGTTLVNVVPCTVLELSPTTREIARVAG